jgi:hypothetical protein
VKAGIQQIKRLVRRGEQEIRQEEPTRERFQREKEAPIVNRNQQQPRTEAEDKAVEDLLEDSPYVKPLHLRLADSPNADDLEAMINLIYHHVVNNFDHNWIPCYVQIAISAQFHKMATDRIGNYIFDSGPYRRLNRRIITANDVPRVIRLCLDAIVDEIQEKELSETQWKFMFGINCWVRFYKYTPFLGRGYLPTPEWLKKSKSVINIRNNDDNCFLVYS